jgi:hypothetical protein
MTSLIDLNNIALHLCQWRNVQTREPDNLFFNRSNIFIVLCNIIETLKRNNVIGVTSAKYIIRFVNLNIAQRNCLYEELYKLNIPFTKLHTSFDNLGDVIIDIFNTWTIKKFTSLPSWMSTNQTIENFYNNTTYLYSDNYDYNGNIIQVSLTNYLKYCKLISQERIQRNNNTRIQRSTHIRVDDFIIINNRQTNLVVKLEIANLLFDIKEKITDGEYKDILEKLATIKSS